MQVLPILSFLVGFVALLVAYISRCEPLADLEMTDLSDSIQRWHSKGKMYSVLGHQMFAIVEGEGKETLILIHGFPTSSYDYHRALPHLTKHFRVVMFDQVGYGFSSKPSNYTYSMADQAEQALALFKILGINKAHLVAHDMGDSVLTEILSRRDRNSLPHFFTHFIQSVGFTNGGMRYHLASLRFSQRLLLSPLGPTFTDLQSKTSASDMLTRQQLASIWGKFTQHMEEDIASMIGLLKYRGGHRLVHKTVTYLVDRARLEPRWVASLERLDIPALVFWGDTDAVAPVAIAHSISAVLPQSKLVQQTLQDTGHFIMLEQPEVWANTLQQFVYGIGK